MKNMFGILATTHYGKSSERAGQTKIELHGPWATLKTAMKHARHAKRSWNHVPFWRTVKVEVVTVQRLVSPSSR